MFHSKAGTTLAAAVALMTGACGDTDPAAPATPAVANPQYLYTNGPNTLNVFRTSDHFVFPVPDFQAGLLAWVGLAADPTQELGCPGGSLPLTSTPLQVAGVYNALNLLAVAEEINIHVYDINTYEDTCFSPFIAAGTVHMVFTDNALGVPKPGDNAGIALQGTVTAIPGGETLRVQGEVRAFFSPIDGSFQWVTSRLTLTPVGGK